MSRFPDDYDEQFPNQGELWWANLARAVHGRKGQQALGELREAMLALPEPKLISGRLANEDEEVCAVGALVVARRCAAGETREDVLRDLAERLGGDDYYCSGDGADVAATAGTKVGLTYSLAWRLAYLNDEDFWRHTPEERYESVLGWIDKQLAVTA